MIRSQNILVEKNTFRIAFSVCVSRMRGLPQDNQVNEE